MIVAKDQFLSWEMMSARRRDWADLEPAARERFSFFQARYAIYHGLELLDVPVGTRVLAPSYICRAAIDPLLAYGMDVDFYAVTRQCEPDYSDLELKVTPSTRAILMVHYFGFPQPMKRLRELCDRRDLVLIEDCAHVLCGSTDQQPIGSFGDIAVFSWRKFLPICDGAELLVNRPRKIARLELAREKNISKLKTAVNMLELSLRESKNPISWALYQGFRIRKAIRKGSSIPAEHSASPAYDSSDTFEFQNAHRPMSSLSAWTKKHSNIGGILARRRRNYEILRDELSSLKGGNPLFPELPQDVCPWVFPFVFKDIPDVHLFLRKRGIPAVAWDGVRHPFTLKDTNANFLYHHWAFLPVHQCLTDKDMVTMAKTIRESV